MGVGLIARAHGLIKDQGLPTGAIMVALAHVHPAGYRFFSPQDMAIGDGSLMTIGNTNKGIPYIVPYVIPQMDIYNASTVDKAGNRLEVRKYVAGSKDPKGRIIFK